MFSVARSKGNLSVRQGGFSLLEIVASAVLIASIAVLAFPTFKDFKPHEADEVKSEEQQPRQEQADLTEAVAAAAHNQKQPVAPKASHSQDLEKASPAENDSLD